MIGRKVGLTSKPMQQLLGVDEPDYGVLLDDMVVEDGDTIALSSLVQPRVEAEMAFLMERDLVGPGVTTAKALAAIAGVLPSIEVVDSRVADWKIKLVDTVADNASSGLFVMGGSLRKVTELDLPLARCRGQPQRRGHRHRRGSGGAGQSRTLRRLAGQQTGDIRRRPARRRHRAAGCGAQDGRRRSPETCSAPTSPESGRSPHDSPRASVISSSGKPARRPFVAGAGSCKLSGTRQRRWRYSM